MKKTWKQSVVISDFNASGSRYALHKVFGLITDVLISSNYLELLTSKQWEGKVWGTTRHGNMSVLPSNAWRHCWWGFIVSLSQKVYKWFEKKKKLKAQHLVVFNTLFLKTIGVNFLKLGSIANGSPTSHSTTIITWVVCHVFNRKILTRICCGTSWLVGRFPSVSILSYSSFFPH